jgi:hypothetical protein
VRIPILLLLALYFFHSMNLFKRCTASLLIASTTLLGTPMLAQAGMVSSTEAMAPATQSDARAKVAAVLAREDVRSGMAERGLSVAQAQDRVNAMSDEEVASLAGRIDQAPAGGDILGVLFTIFIILLITDILGLTKVYPFTRSVR